MSDETKRAIVEGKTFLGIELGSTRIKAALVDESYAPIAQGFHDWENRFEGGMWTYRLDEVWTGLADCFRSLNDDLVSRYGAPLATAGAIGISAMMHGYLVFDRSGQQLVPFRTWRNTTTERAAAALTREFRFNIPLRWSVAHLYQAILDGEPHVGDIAFMTTLAGYVHWRLTGQKALGVGDASGMFPIDGASGNYDKSMLARFDSLVAGKTGWKLEEILPAALGAGENAGVLSAEGARLLDPSGALAAGIPLCPPEGDAGTGMTATNSVAERTGNVSAGTSIFAMLVLEKPLSRVYPEVDMVTTPAGKPVAMVHCNNCTSDFDAWARVFGEFGALLGPRPEKAALYDALYREALKGEADGGGLLSYNYYGGEPIAGVEQGRPLFVRLPDSRFTLANFTRTLLFSAIAALKLGMDILTEKENVRLGQILGHGGLFKTKGVGQRLLAAALGVPVAVMESAGEGGAWGIALLAAYMARKKDGETLEAFLKENVFSENSSQRIDPDPEDARGFAEFMERYKKGIAIERAAIENLKRD
jgi:sugar (pentulose or hexulose) kinase